MVESYEPEEDKKEHNINIQYYGTMNQLVHRIVFEEKMMPQIYLDGQMVSRLALKMKQKEINITITIVDVDKSLSTDSGSFVVEDLDILKYTERNIIRHIMIATNG